METDVNINDKYSKVKQERSKKVDELLSSKSNKKVVVAGPGTGKTYLFSRIMEGKENNITLTFINSLVEDLSLELCGLSDVKTLHSYARSILSQITRRNIRIYPKLAAIIKEDAQILINQDVDFERIFNERNESDKQLLAFYKKRRQYYNYYGFSDIIYTAVLYFESLIEKIPVYDQIVVDEFQDFNQLEVDFIDVLANKSPVLLAGDDDQALYQFKCSSSHHIRERYSKPESGYESFNFPYCSRCTKVIVAAVNDLIVSAKSAGYLKSRIEKPFLYFDNEEKDNISGMYPKICYAQVFPHQVTWFIETKIFEMAKDLRSKFSVLIISPYKKQSKPIGIALKAKGLQNVEYVTKDKEELTILDGFRILLDDKQDNLGWRIVLKFLCHQDELNQILKKTDAYPVTNFFEIVPEVYKKMIKQLLTTLKYILKNRTVNAEHFNDLIKTLNIEPQEIISSHLKKEIELDNQPIGKHEIRKIPIKATTIQSSKGLSGDLVFITHFDDQYYIENDNKSIITDHDICNFLVSMSRTKKKLYLVSTSSKIPAFLNWISKDKIDIIRTI